MPQQHPPLASADALPDDLLLDLVGVFQTLSDPTRAQLINLLTRREYSVNELSQYVAVTPSAVSHHLAKLRDRRLVRTRQRGHVCLLLHRRRPRRRALFARRSPTSIMCAGTFLTTPIRWNSRGVRRVDHQCNTPKVPGNGESPMPTEDTTPTLPPTGPHPAHDAHDPPHDHAHGDEHDHDHESRSRPRARSRP